MVANSVIEIVAEVDEVLRQTLGKQLFIPKEADQIRLLRLRVWKERYKVSIPYILGHLVPHFEKLSSRHRKQGVAPSKGIGTTIAILTGPAAEAYLKQCIAKDYVDDEHIISWREDLKAECISKIEKDADDIVVKKPKSILQYNTIKDFRTAYIARIDRERRSSEKLTKQLGKQPWRGNPFR